MKHLRRFSMQVSVLTLRNPHFIKDGSTGSANVGIIINIVIVMMVLVLYWLPSFFTVIFLTWCRQIVQNLFLTGIREIPTMYYTFLLIHFAMRGDIYRTICQHTRMQQIIKVTPFRDLHYEVSRSELAKPFIPFSMGKGLSFTRGN